MVLALRQWLREEVRRLPQSPTTGWAAATAGQMKRGRLYVIAAPSGAGKTSLLLRADAPAPGVSRSRCPARRASPRPGEHTGKGLPFIDREGLRAAPRKGGRIHDTRMYSATSTARCRVRRRGGARRRSRPRSSRSTGKAQGEVRDHLPDAVQIFVLPPSRAELEARAAQARQSTVAEADRAPADGIGQSRCRTGGTLTTWIVNRDFDAWRSPSSRQSWTAAARTTGPGRPELETLARELLGIQREREGGG